MSYYGTITINGTECIGTSLSSINFNAINFDTLLYGLSGQVSSIKPTNASSIAIGWEDDYTCGNQNHFYIMYDNTVRGVGLNSSYQLAALNNGSYAVTPEICCINNWNPNTDSIIAVYNCANNAYLLSKNGRVWVSGYCAYGISGGAGTNGTNLPFFTNITALNSVVVTKLAISRATPGTQNISIYALTNNGKIYAWGDNTVGQLGLGITGGIISTPTLISDSYTYTDIMAGGLGGATYMMAIANDGSSTYVRSCGYNGYGQLGLGNNTSSNTLQTLQTIGSILNSNADRIVAFRNSGSENGRGSVFFISANGKLWSCGNNLWGQLGLPITANDSVNNYTPLQITTGDIGSNVVDLQCTCAAYGGVSVCALLSNGKIRTWGYNGYGVIGNAGNSNSVTTPTSPNVDFTDVKSISIASNGSSVIIRDIGNNGVLNYTVWTCGCNVQGQLGLGDFNAAGSSHWTYSQVPLAIGSGVYVVKARFAQRDNNQCATLQIMLSNGTILVAGYDGYYALGNDQGTTSARWLPTLVRF